MAHYQKVIIKLRQLRNEIPTIVGEEMVNYAHSNLRKESFDGEKWPPRKPGAPRDQGRRLLMDTGDGQRSIRKIRQTDTEVDVSANDYMEAHNRGARISGTFAVKGHTRRRNGRAITVKPHTRNVNTVLPTRTFLAPSPALNKRITKAILKRWQTLIG